MANQVVLSSKSIPIIVDAIVSITIMTIILFFQDTPLKNKVAYVFICILIGLIGRLILSQALPIAINTAIRDANGVTVAIDYLKTIDTYAVRVIPIIIMALSLPVIFFIIHTKQLDYVMYGALPLYGLFLVATAFITPHVYNMLPRFDDLFIPINNLLGYAKTNVIPIYFALFIPFFIKLIKMTQSSGISWFMMITYILFISLTVDY